jgi:glycerophosphoryl diester phosphodiesterase
VLLDTRSLDVELLLDIKPAPYLDLDVVVAEAAESQRLAGIIFGVRSLEDRARLAGLQPDLRFLGFVPRPDQIESFLAAGVEIVRVWPHWLARQPEVVETIHRAGARVWVTAGQASVEELRALAAFGVDGLLTDRPAAALTELDCRRR